MSLPPTVLAAPPIRDPQYWASRLQSAHWPLILLALWLLATLGLRPLMLPDEGRYAMVAREMLLGDGLVPTMNGLPFFHKPPLFYWIDMAAMHLFGITPFAARVAPMLGAWLMGASLFLAMRRWHGPRVAVIALGVLATAPFFFLGAQYANHDMLVAGLITVAVLALARAVEDAPRVALGWLVAGWVACALAVLSKGLIGIVLPALVIGPWLLAQGRWRQMLKLLHPLGVIAFVVVCAPWFVAMQMRYPAFFDYFFMEQHFRRFSQSKFNNVQPFWFFIFVVPALTLPWAAWIPAAAKRLWPQRDSTLALYAWWVIVVVGFFSLPSSKLIGYVLPAVAPWCALLGLAVAQSTGRAWVWVMGGAAALCLAVVVGLTWQAPKSSRPVALALAERIGPLDKVVMVEGMFYDVPLYANLRRPVLVSSSWADPDSALRDNWRKELLDAVRFNPAQGAAVLLPLERLDSVSCGGAPVWFIAKTGESARVAALTGATRTFGDKYSELWHAPGRVCP